MKTNQRYLICVIMFFIFGKQISNGQSWSLTGNAGTSPGVNFMGTTDAKALYLRTNNQNRLVISSLGRVGIGTASPLEKLQVKGASILANNSAINTDLYLNSVVAGSITDSGGWSVQSGIGGSAGSTGSTWGIGATGNGLYFGFGNGSTSSSMLSGLQIMANRNVLLVPGSNGNVGIGNNNPTYKLDLNCGASSSAIKIDGTNPTIAIKSTSVKAINFGSDIAISGAVGGAGFNPGNVILQGPGGAMGTFSGKVGIGTLTPDLAKFVVEGMYGNTVAIFKGNSTGKGLSIVSDNPGLFFNSYWNNGHKAMASGYAGLVNFDPSTGNLYLGTSASQSTNAGDAVSAPARLLISKDGNVGIGLSNPANKLDVCGTIRGKEVRVETGWCDYVFADDYKLPSLYDVEKFVKENKHLPDVTAGKIIESEGLELGKTSSQMIKKIEELTLYVIELQKQVDALKASK